MNIDDLRHKIGKIFPKLLVDYIYPQFSIYPPLSNNLVLILGCQRSGNTLSMLMLDSHPKISGIDEEELNFLFPYPNILARNKNNGYLTLAKLPNKVRDLKYIAKNFPDTKIVWPIRHPFSVVSSMRAWKNPDGTNWLQKFAKPEMKKLYSLFPENTFPKIESLDEISLGAYIWYIKCLAISKYKANNIEVIDYRFEDLLEKPREVLSDILKFLELEWNDNVLNHEKFQAPDSRYIGNTRGDKPLDKSRKEPKLKLTKQEVEKITSICHKQMKQHDYSVDFGILLDAP